MPACFSCWTVNLGAGMFTWNPGMPGTRFWVSTACNKPMPKDEQHVRQPGLLPEIASVRTFGDSSYEALQEAFLGRTRVRILYQYTFLWMPFRRCDAAEGTGEAEKNERESRKSRTTTCSWFGASLFLADSSWPANKHTSTDTKQMKQTGSELRAVLIFRG